MTLHEAIVGKIIIDPFKEALEKPGLCPFTIITARCNFKKLSSYERNKEINPLIVAVDMGCLELAKCLIEEGADVNTGKINTASPLIRALIKQDYDIARYLIGKGADVKCVDGEGLTPMYYAITEKSPIFIVQDLLSHGVSKDGPLGRTAIEDEATPIAKAVIERNIPVVKFLLKQSVQLNYPLAEGDSTPLSLAVIDDCFETVQLLIKNGAKVEGQDDENLNPLVAAIFKNNVATIRLLLAAGADVHKTYDLGKIARSTFGNGEIDSFDLFRSRVLSKEEPDVTALHLAILTLHYEAAKVLLEAGSPVNKLTRFSKRTALSFYCYIQANCEEGRDLPSHQQRMVQILLHHGSDMHSKDHNNCTPVMMCCMGKLHDIIPLFVDAGLDVNADMLGVSLLFFMTESEVPSMVKLCLEYGGDARRPKKTPVYERALTKGVHIAKLFFPYHPVDGFSPSALQCHSRRNFPGLSDQYKYFDGIKNNKESAVRTALRNGAEPRAFLKLMPFPIFYPVSNQNVIMLRTLLESGVWPNVRNKEHLTPLHIGAMKRSAECCRVLLKHGACYNAKSSASQSPLKVADGEEAIRLLKDIHLMFRKAAQGDLKFVKDSLKQMPDEIFYSYVNCVNRKGNTLMQEAIHSGATQVAEAVMNLRLNREN